MAGRVYAPEYTPAAVPTVPLLTVGGGVLAVAGFAASGMLGPYSRDRGYAANRKGIRASPPPDSIIAAYYSGRLGGIGEPSTVRIRDTLLAEHGIYWDGNTLVPESELSLSEILTMRGIAWRGYLDLQAPWPDFNLLRNQWLREKPGYPRELLHDALRRQGFSNPRWINTIIDASVWLDVPQALLLFWAGKLGDDETVIRKILRANGYTDESVIDQLLSMSSPVTPQESLILRNRELIDDDEMKKYLRWSGLRDERVIDRFSRLRYEIPGPSDLVRFSVREAWQEDIVRAFGYDDEFPEIFQHWMERQGMGWAGEEVTISGVTYPSVSWPQAYWRSHWQLPSPGQGYEFLRRCRGDIDNPASWRIQGLRPFTSSDLNKLLRTADYPPYFRPYLEAVSYRVPTRVDVRRMLTLGTIDSREATELYRDMGYDLSASRRLTQFAEQQIATQRATKLLSGVRSQTIRAYRVGSMSRQDAASSLYLLSLPSAQLITDFQNLSTTEQHSVALENTSVRATLDSIDIDIRARLIEKAINAIRRAFIRLDVPADRVRTALLELGITQSRVDDYLSLWNYQLLERGKVATASNISTWVTRGLLSPVDALSRLLRLGYTVPDATAMIGVAAQNVDLHAAQIQAKIAHSAKQAQNAAIAQLKALKQAQKQAQADLAKHGSPAKLAKWLSMRLLGVPEFRLRLTALGWPTVDIDRLQVEALQKPPKKVSKNGQATLPDTSPPQTKSGDSGAAKG